MRYTLFGGRGLLGSAVGRAVRASGDVLDAPTIPWNSAATATRIRASVMDTAGREGSPWQIIWCAGAGVSGSTVDALDTELSAFRVMLDAVSEMPPGDRARGSVVFSSSAGGVYAGSTGAPFDERTAPGPLNDYGRYKLHAEEALREFGAASGIATLSVRIANLYGPGQALTKPQGLITHLCIAHLTRQPISVFVPIDTLRDYLYVDDCADMLLASGRELVDGPEAAAGGVKILCSGTAISIAGVLGELRRVARRATPLVMSRSALSEGQARDLRLRSVVMTDIDRRPFVTLADGIARTMAGLRLALNREGTAAPLA